MDEQKRLALLLDELRRRGIDPAQKIKLPSEHVFPTDSQGFFTKNDGNQYNPTDAHLDFYSSNARFVAFIGARGSGKTAAGAQKALKKISEGKNGAVLNPDFSNFRVSTWPEFREWIPWEMVVPRYKYMANPDWFPNQPFVITFVNGVRVICKGLKDPDSARGPNINWLWYDEAGRDRDGLSWKYAIASVRVGEEPQAWITTTPRGKQHWIYEFFEKQDIPEEVFKAFAEQEKDRSLVEIFYGSIFDNKENLDPGFYASLLAAYPAGWLRLQEVEGKFVEEGGVLGDPAWFRGKVVPSRPEQVKSRIRYWDLAASEKKISGRKRNDPDETVGTRLSWVPGDPNEFYIEDQRSGYWKWKDIKDQIVATAERDGPYVRVFVEQEPGAGGKNQVEELKIYIQEQLGKSWKVEGHRPEGDKIMRANAWFAEAANGQFYLVQGNWNEAFLDQLSGFPEGRHDDKIDSVSGARQIIAPFKQWRHISFLHL